VLEFLRDIGKHFSVNRMLDRESVKARLEAGGISYTEFSYQLLQAMDFLELYRRYGCTAQLGGSDQWGNLVAGVDLIRRVEGASVHALATSLITKPDGTKYGKTEGGAIWLSADLMSPYAFYQFWLNVSDAEVPGLLKVFSFKTPQEIEALAAEGAERPAARLGQRALAEEVTTLVHGADECRRVIAASQALFGQAGLPTPAIWTTPLYAASAPDYAGISQVYTTKYEEEMFFGGELSGQPIDYTHVFGQFFPYEVHDLYGSTVIPENLGDYQQWPTFGEPAVSAQDILDEAQQNLALPQGVASFYLHPDTDPLAVLEQVVTGLKAEGYTFASPQAFLASNG